jgi:tubulin---tyrosine ligase
MKESLKSRSNAFGVEEIALEDVRAKVKIHNHFINNFIIGNKKALFQTMSEYYSKMNKDVFEYLPLTFHIKQGINDDEYLKFCQNYYALGKAIKQDPQHLNKFNAWIVKPG